MIIRIQSPSGTKKFEASESDKLGRLLKSAEEGFAINSSIKWYLSTTRDGTGRIKKSSNTSLSSLGLKHGDMLFLIYEDRAQHILSPGDTCGEDNDTISSSRGLFPGRSVIVEDKIDQELAKMDGQIKRKRNDQLCHHPPSGQCIHCVPLEPYDAAYLEHLDPPVKFMSFHAYLRKLSGGQGKGKFVTLENLSCHIRPGCREHPPWPEGICTKCQPNPVTLEIQPYRHVDYVQFENGQIMETFLDFWRQTGRQRIGIMLGRYAHFDTAGAPPLAIKAVVAAIYEPPQDSTTRSVRLTVPLDSLLPSNVVEVAKRLELKPVGWIFTDLVAEDQPGKGSVKHYRGTMDTFFLSAEECITAAHLQNLYPNVCSFSPDGCFGSKFVTVVVTGDSSNEIHFEAYQVSNQAMALERDRILVPTYDAPEFGYIRETTKEQFVPEVFYTMTDKYGNRVTRVARPLPVEYLLIDMPSAFPIEPVYSLAKLPPDIPVECRFPVENREQLGQIQDFPAFARFLKALESRPLYACLGNFHLLAWLAGNDSLPLRLTDPSDCDPHGLPGLLSAIAGANTPVSLSSAERLSVAESSVANWSSESPAWATIQELAKAVSGDLTPSPHAFGRHSRSTSRAVPGFPGLSDQREPATPTRTANQSDFWACTHCTFHNQLTSTECEMCGLPRQA